MTSTRGQIGIAQIQRRKGFILPLTLWMIAIIGFLAASLNTWVAKAVANSRALADRTAFELTQSNVRNELVYMLGSRPISYRGLEVGRHIGFANPNDFNAALAGPTDSGRSLKLDGRPYISEADDNIVIALQDGAGLLNLNTVTAPNLRRVLAAYNIPEETSNRLIDTLLDYIDDDDFTRLAGAERPQYERLGLRPPSNGFLLTPFEAQQVLGWDKLGDLWKNDMESPLLTTCQTSGFNPNTSPAQVLTAIMRGLTREKAEKVLTVRAAHPFRNIREFGAAADLLMNDEPFFYTFVASNCFIVDMIDKRSDQHVRFSLTIDPTSSTRPWRVDYAIRIPPQYRVALDHLDPEATFPTPESIDLSPPGDDGKAGAK